MTPFCNSTLVKLTSAPPLLIVATLWLAFLSLKMLQVPEPLTTRARVAYKSSVKITEEELGIVDNAMGDLQKHVYRIPRDYLQAHRCPGCQS
jgi:hypothetical protein